MVCPMLKKGDCKKSKKKCNQKYSIKMIKHENCKIFGGKAVKEKVAKEGKKK
jgi:spore coat protein CotF